MKIEIDLNTILGSEDANGQTLEEAIRDHVIKVVSKRITAKIDTELSARVDAAISEALTKAVQEQLTATAT